MWKRFPICHLLHWELIQVFQFVIITLPITTAATPVCLLKKVSFYHLAELDQVAEGTNNGCQSVVWKWCCQKGEEVSKHKGIKLGGPVYENPLNDCCCTTINNLKWSKSFIEAIIIPINVRNHLGYGCIGCLVAI